MVNTAAQEGRKVTLSPNPYQELDNEYQVIDKKKKEVEAQLASWHERFVKVFFPDQTEFDALKSQAKDLQFMKAPIKQLDEIYLKMAMIYKRWLPIKSKLYQMNPSYHELFKGLELLLNDVEEKHGNKTARKTNRRTKRGNSKALSKRSIKK